MTDLDCPLKRCTGHLGQPDATGHDTNGRQLEWRTCTACGRLSERVLDAPVDHPELDLGGGT